MAKDLELQVTLKGAQAELALRSLTGKMQEANLAQMGLSKSSSLTEKAFKGLGNVYSSVRDTLNTYTKYAALAAVATGGVIVANGIKNTLDYTAALGLLNATLRGSPETMGKVSSAILDISNHTGQSVGLITDAMTQLFSSGMAPSGVQGSKQYEDDLKNVFAIQSKIAETAVGTGETARNIGDAYVFAANALNLNIKSTDTANHIMNLFSATLDTGIGTMSQYSDQFVKFVKDAKQAGLTDNEAFATFSKMTLSMSPEEAGHVTSALMKGLNNAPLAINMGVNRIKRALKESIASGTLTDKEAQLFNADKIFADWDSIFYKKGPNGQNIKKSFTETMQGITDTLNKTGGPGTKAFDVFLGALGVNINEKKALQSFYGEKGGMDFFKSGGLLDQFNKEVADGKVSSEKFAAVTESLGVKFQILKERFTNAAIGIGMALTPAANTMLDTFLTMSQGGTISADKIKKAFNDARDTLDKNGQGGLKWVVDKMEQLTKMVTDGTIQKGFDNMAASIQPTLDVLNTVFSVISAIVKALWWIGGKMGDFAAINVIGAQDTLDGLTSLLPGSTGTRTQTQPKFGNPGSTFKMPASVSPLKTYEGISTKNMESILSQILVATKEKSNVGVSVSGIGATSGGANSLNLGPGGSASNPVYLARSPGISIK